MIIRKFSCFLAYFENIRGYSRRYVVLVSQSLELQKHSRDKGRIFVFYRDLSKSLWFLKLICPKTRRFVITAGDLLISSVILIMFTKLFTNLSIPVIIL